MFNIKLFTLIVILNLIKIITTKYVEGHLKTLDNWAFVARFCFLSGKGRYEYNIEFERGFYEPKLLLYYDDKSQWPSVYKTEKTCLQKLSVLSVVDNQMVTLSARSPYNVISGCAIRTSEAHEEDEKESIFPLYEPENHNEDKNFTGFEDFNLTNDTNSYDDNFLHLNFTSFNETDIFNITKPSSFLPVGTDIGFENKMENNTHYLEYVEELFEGTLKNNTKRIRIKRGFYNSDRSGKYILTCRKSGGFLTARERWWYIAISNCGSKNGIDIKYKFRMTNGPPGDFWHEHFSADEMYILPILLTESVFYTFILLAIFICAVELKTRHLFHCTYRLFGISALLHYLGILLTAVSWTKYAVTGIGPYLTFGTILQGAGEIVFLSMLLLMAKGYTITRARLSSCSTLKLTIFFNLYVICYISLFIYREEVFDPGEVLNLYESPAGLGLAGLRCGSWAAFLLSTITTVRKFPEKSRFYYPFGIVGSTWILGGPLLTIIGIGFFDPWVRESVMCGVLAILAISGHVSFLWLTWPSRANHSFPYHVRTNHVGATSFGGPDDDGSDYPRHVYAPSRNPEEIIIPLSRRTEDLLNSVYSQYMDERNFYNSTSTPHSYVSFPQELRPSAPAAPTRTYGNGEIHDDEEINPSRRTTINEEEDNQNDSGHPSIDDSSPKVTNNSVLQESSGSAPRLLKNNPFIINGIRSPPNKIILEPINPPVIGHLGNVPKHLFAARSNLDS